MELFDIKKRLDGLNRRIENSHNDCTYYASYAERHELQNSLFLVEINRLNLKLEKKLKVVTNYGNV